MAPRKPSISRRSRKPNAATTEAATTEDAPDFYESLSHNISGILVALNAIATQMKERNDLLSQQMRPEDLLGTQMEPEDARLPYTDSTVGQRLEALEVFVKSIPVSLDLTPMLKRVEAVETALQNLEHFTGKVEGGVPANGEAPKKRGRPTNAEKAAREAAAAQPAVAPGTVLVEERGRQNMVLHGGPVEEKPATPNYAAQVVAEVKEKLAPTVLAAPQDATEEQIKAHFAAHPHTRISELVKLFKVSLNRAEAYVELYGTPAPKPAAAPYKPPRPCPGCGANLDESNVVHSKACSVVNAATPVTMAAPAPSPAAPAVSQPVQAATLTLDDVRAVAIVYSGKHGKDKVAGLLKKYGAAKLSDVAPEQYASLMAELQNGNAA